MPGIVEYFNQKINEIKRLPAEEQISALMALKNSEQKPPNSASDYDSSEQSIKVRRGGRRPVVTYGAKEGSVRVTDKFGSEIPVFNIPIVFSPEQRAMIDQMISDLSRSKNKPKMPPAWS